MTFKDRVMTAKEGNPQYNIRYLAFVEHLGGEAFKGTVASRNARYMAWIADRKAQYKERYAHMLIGGNLTISNQDHFTNFIVSGEWL